MFFLVKSEILDNFSKLFICSYFILVKRSLVILIDAIDGKWWDIIFFGFWSWNLR